MEDIRTKQHALEVKRVWKMVGKDPHLMRLGDWLVDKDEESPAEKWRQERMFLRTPWIWDIKVILVESPDYDIRVILILMKFRILILACCHVFPTASLVSKLFLFSL